MEYLAGIVFGILVSAAVAAALSGRRAQRAYAEGRASLEREQAIVLERLSSREAEIARLTAELQHLQAAADQLRTQHQQSIASAAALRAELEAERSTATEKLKVLEQAREQLSNAFQALSAQALQSNNEAFIQLATQTLGQFQKGAEGALEKRQQAIGELVGPVKQTLEKLEGRLAQVDKDREGSYQAVNRHLESLRATQDELRRETGNLVKALRQPAARGRWGELQLRRVVEMAGMLEYCDFEEQVSSEGNDGRLRPDLIVRLPGGKNIVIDAKTPLAAYLDALEATDDAVRQQRMVEHARAVRDHMTKLGRKSYQEQFEPSPDLVVLFLPGEMFFSGALQHDPELIEFGVGEKVIPATPTTLIALLRAVAYGWKQEALARNAQEISELGRELFERVSTLASHWKSVGKNLGSAVAAYNQSVGTLESRVLVSARKFRDLKVSGAKEIEDLVPVETVPRMLQAVEMVKSLEGVV